MQSFRAIIALVIASHAPISVIAKQQPDDFKITSPADGSLVHPGQTLDIQIWIAPGKAVDPMFIISPLGTASVSDTAPYRATFQIPATDDRGTRLIGRQNITLFGRRPGHEVLAGILVDVEKEHLPIKLITERRGVSFQDLGDRLTVPMIMGYWADGSYFDLQESTYLSMRSSDPDLFSVDERGNMIALAPGKATLQVKYALGSEETSLSIPVTMPKQALRVLPRSTYVGMVQVGKASISVPVSATNVSTAPQHLRAIRVPEHFEETDDCALPGTLSPAQTCTIKLTWHPKILGEMGGGIDIELGEDEYGERRKITIFITGSAVDHLP